jgi:hypothetical protein
MLHNHLTQLGLARRWRLSPRSLERWRITGEGPIFLKVGKRIVYRLEDVLAFEKERLKTITVEGNRGSNFPAVGPVRP